MSIRRKALLRIGATLTLAYVALGTLIIAYGLLNLTNSAPVVGTKVAQPWHVDAAMYFHSKGIWFLVGIPVNGLALVAFFREAAGLRARRLLWWYGAGIVLLALVEIGAVLYLKQLGWIQTYKLRSVSGAVMYGWQDVLAACAIGVFLCLPLLYRLGVAVLCAGAAPEGPGYCSTCGYNLTGNVSGVCPECGSEVPFEASGC